MIFPEFIQAELNEKISSLTTELNRSNTATNQWKASHVRMESVFGRTSLFSTESALCGREVAVVAAAALGSTVSQMYLQLILDRFVSDNRSTAVDQRISLLSLSGDENENESINGNENEYENENMLKKPTLQLKNVREVDVGTIRQVMVVLRATCVCWHCVGFVLGDANGVDISGIVSTTSSALHHLFEVLQTLLDQHKQKHQHKHEHKHTKHQHIKTYNSVEELEHLDDNLIREIECATSKLTELLCPHFQSMGILDLPLIPIFSSGKRGTGTSNSGDNHTATTPSSVNFNYGNDSLRNFHLSCQSSYLSLGCHLFAAFMSSKISNMKSYTSPSSTYSTSASPLTANSRISEEDGSGFNEIPKGIVPSGSSPHLGVISEMCATVRTELESLGLLSAGGILYALRRSEILSEGPKGGEIESKKDEKEKDNEKVEKSAITIEKNIVVDVRDEIKLFLLDCFDQLIRVLAASGSSLTDEINVSPALLRACLSNLSDIKSLIIPQNSNLKMSGNNFDIINVINILSSNDIDMLWQLLLNNDNNIDTNNNNNNNNDDDNDTGNTVINNHVNNKDNKWDNLLKWKKRSKIHSNTLQIWEKSQDEILIIKKSLEDTHIELKSRIDELKASKSAYQELNNLVLNSSSSFLSSTSISNKKNSNETAELSSSSSRKGNNVPDESENVAKLKAEVEV